MSSFDRMTMKVGEAVLPAATADDVLDLVNLSALMARTSGSADIAIGLVDGPVSMRHPDLAGHNIREIGGSAGATCARADSVACRHGTFVAGILSAKRGSAAPALCPDCVLLVRPIFSDGMATSNRIPSATPEELAAAIVECIDAGARVVNVSAALAATPTVRGGRALEQALEHAWLRGVIVVVAAGNQGLVGGTALTQHRAVIAASACDRWGRPVNASNLGRSIGQRGLSAPGEGITSLGIDMDVVSSGGTSVAAPFVTGAIALVWSQFPDAAAGQVRLAVTLAHSARRRTVVPPLLNAWAICTALGHLVRRG